MTGKYNIKDLEILSGIKAHTLRIWEQRYGILQPQRTDTNIRFYSNNDLKRILNVSALNKHGVKISKIAQLNEIELNEAVKQLTVSANDKEGLIDGLIVAMVDLDEEMFNRIVSVNSVNEGFEKTVTDVLFPFLRKIGLMWQTDSINPAQEHFVTNLIRQKIVSAIDSIKGFSGSQSKKVIFYLPEGELHEISLLFYAYMAKARGYCVVYLGQSVPFIDLVKVCGISHPNLIVSVFTQPLKDNNLEDYLSDIEEKLPKQRIHLSGYQIIQHTGKLPKNVSVFKNPADFVQLL